MNNVVTLSSLFVVGLTQVQAQGDGQDTHEPAPLTVIECEVGEEVLSGDFDSELWAARLAEGDLDLRMAAYEAIVEAGSRDRTVFDCMQQWATDPSRGELAWTARMALREIERVPVIQEDPWGFGTGTFDWFQDSPIGRMGVSPLEFERSLQEKFEQLQRQMEKGFAPGAAPGRGVEQRLFSLEFGPDGMKMRTRQVDAEGDKEQQWEAQNIEELFKAHPELESEFPGLGGLRIRFGTPSIAVAPAVPPADEGPRTDVLGVECRVLAPGEAEVLGLPEGSSGLLVVRTVPGTIADELGVRRGDVLTSLNGAPLSDPLHITQALSRREAGALVHLRLFDAQVQERSVVWSPQEPGADELLDGPL